MNNICRVRECRFKNTHMTKVHICGICHQKGHGQIECSNPFLKLTLADFYDEILDENDRCEYLNCIERNYHKSIAHICENCKKYGHSNMNCPLKIKEIKCPICRTKNKIPLNQKKVTGIDIECSICLNNKVEIYLNNCGHICICNDCLFRIN